MKEKRKESSNWTSVSFHPFLASVFPYLRAQKEEMFSTKKVKIAQRKEDSFPMHCIISIIMYCSSILHRSEKQPKDVDIRCTSPEHWIRESFFEHHLRKPRSTEKEFEHKMVPRCW